MSSSEDISNSNTRKRNRRKKRSTVKDPNKPIDLSETSTVVATDLEEQFRKINLEYGLFKHNTLSISAENSSNTPNDISTNIANGIVFPVNNIDIATKKIVKSKMDNVIASSDQNSTIGANAGFIRLKSNDGNSQNKQKNDKTMVFYRSESVDCDKFEDYLTEEEVKSDETLIEGSIRINSMNFKEAYIKNPSKNEQDILIESIRDRNRALDGDTVLVKLKDKAEWNENQKTAKVVYIKQIIHPRTCVGFLAPMPNKNNKKSQYALFKPKDSRIPRIKIPSCEWTKEFYGDPKKYDGIIFLAKLTDWPDVKFAEGVIIEQIGSSGDLDVETKAILLENCLDYTPFGPEMNQYFPETDEIPQVEYETREDLRKMCILTIDPKSTRDIDDAVSCVTLPNGNLEIGVHISDVTYYLKEGTPLDEIVVKKATTIYLVNRVFHMLPTSLCAMCSLLPGKDRLAFSVFWEMTPDGEVISHRFNRTVLNSCSQFAYEDAQKIIENPDKTFSKDDFPTIHGEHSIQKIVDTVNKLYVISENLRFKRFEGGALRIDQIKLAFKLDPQTMLPIDFFIYENKECHRLIEEFMLLANITVANKLRNDFPDLAFLRQHSPPHEHMMVKLQRQFETIGIHLDVTSAGSLQKSIIKYSGDDKFAKARSMVINYHCTKPMTRALYFCAGDKEDEEFSHFALNVPLYTHFTSPIRRYADVMVHRLLAASLNYCEKPAWEINDVINIAGNCNKQKYNAKKAGEQSSEYYLLKYIETHQPIFEEAVVVDVKARSFDILILSKGQIVRIYENKLDPIKILSRKRDDQFNVTSYTLQWPADGENEIGIIKNIDIFTFLQVKLTLNNSQKIEATLEKPTS